MREIVLDTETTGLSPLGGDRVVEIGCVELMNRVPTGRTFHAYFNPGRPMPSEAEAVHGLTDVFLSDKPLFTELCEELLGFIQDAPIVAHNAPFDFGFLNHELSLCGRASICTTRMVDTLVLARQRLPGAKHSLDALCSRFGVDRSIRIKHGALIDAQLLAQVYIELAGGRQIGLGLVAEERPREELVDVVLIDPASAAITATRTPRVHAPTAEELARHAEFLKKIDNPLWNSLPAAS
jgi:DNA polymerase III subunit epsilon